MGHERPGGLVHKWSAYRRKAALTRNAATTAVRNPTWTPASMSSHARVGALRPTLRGRGPDWHWSDSRWSGGADEWGPRDQAPRWRLHYQRGTWTRQAGNARKAGAMY